MHRFVFMDKARAAELLPACFAILHGNRNAIASTGDSDEEDFRVWYGNVAPALGKEPRQIVLMYAGEELAGFFQYYVAGGIFMMEEIQLLPAYQGTGLFRAFYTWLLPRLGEDIQWVEAYAHKDNLKSQAVLAHLGLRQRGAVQEGEFLHFRGEYAALRSRFL